MRADVRDLDLLTVGEAMGLVVAEDIGPLATADRARLRVGGSEFNVAIAASRLGASAAWVGRLGADGIGDRIEATLRGEGVEVIARRDASRPTGLMLKERRTAEHTRVSYYRSGSAATQLDADDVSRETFARTRLVHVTGITPALSPVTRAAVPALLDRAREAGAMVSMDVNYRSSLWSEEDAAGALSALLPRVDILFGSLHELALLDREVDSTASAWERLGARGPTQIIVKHGQEGASAATDAGIVQQSAYRVAVLDTVGAGDAFVGGYLSAWLAGGSPSATLEQAARAGALACTVLGDWEGAPTASELALLDAADPVIR